MNKFSLPTELNSNELFDEEFRNLSGVNRALLVATGRFCYDEDRSHFLNGVDSDVDLIRQCLTDERCGFQENDVEVLKTEDYPTLRKINRKLDEILENCGENDFVFLYFSGHGFHENKEKTDYYIPFDAKPVLSEDGEFVTYEKKSCFSFKLLREKIDDCNAKFVWVVVDACRVNAIARNFHRSALDSIGKLEATKSSLWFQSCGINQESEECRGLDESAPDCWHGYFTWYFCEGAKNVNLANKDGFVTPNNLFKHICEKLQDKFPIQTPMQDFKEASLGECRFMDLSDEPRIQVKKSSEEANNLLKLGKYEQAASKYEQTLVQIGEILKREPENQEYQELKKEVEAWSIQTYLSRGLVNLGNGKPLEAIYDADKALQIDKTNEAAYLLREQAKSRINETPKELPLYYPNRSLDDKTAKFSFDKKYRLIKAGVFMMGSPLTGEEIVTKYLKDVGDKGYSKYFSDAPLHKVTLTQDFYLARFPVTKGEFSAFVDETGYKTTAEKEESAWTLTKKDYWLHLDGKNWRDPGFEQSDEHPVVCVSYDDALAYLAWLNEKTNSVDELNGLKPYYRLPTEAEWEYACRAGTTTEFFWGDDEKDGKGNLNAAGTDGGPFEIKWNYHFSFKVGYPATSPVGSFEPNDWNLYDMLGNVWEWTSDWYGDYPKEATTDPEGATKGSYRVLRGGGWRSSPADCRCAYRGRVAPEKRLALNGLRVAFSLTSK